MRNREGSVSSAVMWMFVLSILLFWLPFIGPLVAGFVGGRKAGSVGNAIVAVFLPALVIGGALFFFSTVLMGLPIVGMVAALGGFVLAVSHAGPLLIGAILGSVI